MATETGPDLSFAQAQVELLMDDRCEVFRPAVLDAAGLAAAPRVYPADPGDPDGPCTVSSRSESGSGLGGEDDEYTTDYRGSLPAAVDFIREGDVLVLRSSRRDPQLEGETFVIRRVKRSTFLVSRGLRLERFQPANPDQLP